MIRFAVIGTNWITQRFIDAAQSTGKLKLTAVYSRHKEQAYRFGAPYQIHSFFNSLEALAQSSEIDSVYIASPNSLHAHHALVLLQHRKHVICEKPLASTLAEAQKMVACAHQNQVVLLEAFKTAYLPNFAVIQHTLPRLGTLRKVMLNFCQYSSRYPSYLDGQNPNTFNPHFSSGSIMDIGYYCLASAIQLFGEPLSFQAGATLLKSGVDAHGHVCLNYPGFEVILWHSKVSNSAIHSEIQGEEGTLLIEKLTDCKRITFIPAHGPTEDLTQPQHENTLYYEANTFADWIKAQHIHHSAAALSLSTAKLLTEIRQQTGVIFPADQVK